MANYKLTYFDVKGLGELTRLVFAQAGIEYENIRISHDQWPQLKPTMLYGMMPVLEEKGRQLTGGRVIARYLAEKPEFGLAGNNEFDNAEIAGIVDVIDGFSNEIFKLAFEKDETRKATLVKGFVETEVPKYFGIFRKLLKKNSGFLWGGKLTWADLDLIVVTDFIYNNMKNVFNDYPEIVEFKDKIEALPNIAEYIKNRPVTDH